MSALRIAMALAELEGKRVAVADSEHGSSCKYVGMKDDDGQTFDFDVANLGQMPGKYKVENYLKCIAEVQKSGIYSVLVIDSLSHAWSGPGGILSFVEKAAGRARGNKFAGWREATPLHNKLIEALLGSSLHIIATMRSKVEWTIDKDANGRSVPRKIGMQPEQRSGLEYEFDVVGDMDQEYNKLTISKSRCPALNGEGFVKPGKDLGLLLGEWLTTGAVPPPLDALNERIIHLGLVPEEVNAYCVANGQPDLQARNKKWSRTGDIDSFFDWLKKPKTQEKIKRHSGREGESDAQP